MLNKNITHIELYIAKASSVLSSNNLNLFMDILYGSLQTKWNEDAILGIELTQEGFLILIPQVREKKFWNFSYNRKIQCFEFLSTLFYQ